MNVKGNILEFVNSKAKQTFRNYPCCKRGVKAYLFAPQNRFIPFQLKGLITDSVKSISVIRVDSLGKEQLVYIEYSPSYITKHEIGSLSYFVYNSQQLAYSLTEGNYFLIFEKANGNLLYSQLFEVVSCCLDRIEWRNNCNIEKTGLLYKGTNYYSILYFPSYRLFEDSEQIARIERTQTEYRLIDRTVSRYVLANFGQFFDGVIGAIKAIDRSGVVTYFPSNGENFVVKESSVQISVNDYAHNNCVKSITAKIYREDIVNTNGCCIEIEERIENHYFAPKFSDCNSCKEIDNLSALPHYDHAILTWHGASNVIQYSIYKDGQLIGTTSNNVFFVDNLEPCTEYQFSVVAECRNDITIGANITVSTPDAPCLIDSFSSSSTSTSISANWESSATSFVFYIKEVGANESSAIATSEKSITLNDLKPNTNYVLEIKAVCLCSESLRLNLLEKTGNCPLNIMLLWESENCETGKGNVIVSAHDFTGNYQIKIFDNNLKLIAETFNEPIEVILNKGFYSAYIKDNGCEIYKKFSIDGCECGGIEGLSTASETRGLAVGWKGDVTSIEVKNVSGDWLKIDSTNSIQVSENSLLITNLPYGQAYIVRATNKCGDSVQNELISNVFVHEYCNPCEQNEEVVNCIEEIEVIVTNDCCTEEIEVIVTNDCIEAGAADKDETHIEVNPIQVPVGYESDITVYLRDKDGVQLNSDGGLSNINFISNPTGLTFSEIALNNTGIITAKAKGTIAGFYDISFEFVY